MEGAAWIKLHALVNGIAVDESVSRNCIQGGAAVRRNVYNSPTWATLGRVLPQELKLEDVVLGVNSYGATDWRLTHNVGSESPMLEHLPTGSILQVSYVEDLKSLTNLGVMGLANVYGGAALAFFSPRSCYFFSDETACGFCSLAGTARETPEFKSLLTEDDVRRVVETTLDTDVARIEQIMIVGGNMRDLDRGFQHHVSLARAASEVIAKLGLTQSISVHIATMPPFNLQLLAGLRDIPNVEVMFNLEVWDVAKFSELCPGKEKDYGRSNLINALERLRDVIGPYRAHSILIGGLEQPQSTLTGARTLADLGISPIVNIYHSDRHSRIGLGNRPEFEDLAEVALGLQQLYQVYPIVPYWRTCGRNAIDREAQLGLFRAPVPSILSG